MKDLSAKEINVLIGKVYYFEKELYSQIEGRLFRLRDITGALEEVEDITIKAYLKKEREEIINELLCYRKNWKFDDYPDITELQDNDDIL